MARHNHRTVSGSTVVLLGYLYGIGAGNIPPPTNENIFFDILVIVGVYAITGLPFVRWLIYPLAQFTGARLRMSDPTGIAAFAALLGLVAIFFVLAIYFSLTVGLCHIIISQF